MSDEIDAEVERLLPCEFVTADDPIQCRDTKHAPCASCKHRPAIAAWGRGMESDRQQQLLWCDKKWQTIVADLRREVEWLKAELQFQVDSTIEMMEKE